MSRILACLDASVYSQSVVDHTIWAARLMGAGVDMVSIRGASPARTADLAAAKALDKQPEFLAAEIARDAENERKLDALAAGELDALRRQIEAAGVSPVSARVAEGDLVEKVRAREEGADLVILGKRGAQADFVSLRLGSLTERAARAATRDVLIAARGFRRPRRAVVAVDLGEAGLTLCANAIASPLLKGLEVHVVSAGEETLERSKQLDVAFEQFANARFNVTKHLIPGPVEKTLPEYVDARDIGLLVMGAFSHSRLRNIVSGSTTLDLIRGCKIPVLLPK